MNSPKSEHSEAGIEPYGIVSVASSAGGIVALGKVLGGLSEDFTLPVLVVQRLDPRHQTVIAEVLGRRAKLRVKLAENDEQIEPGTIYVAPPTVTC
jgi:two-component system chemotaxis response regulator CheB